jgi:pyruvate dehydrogenase E2 component (dihydrolipoamide acetyltransferase)
MATAIIIPSYGTSQAEITLLEWKKNVGDPVAKGDVLCELETDKATTDLESFAEGVLLQQAAEAGQDVQTGQVIAYVGQEGEEVPDASDSGQAGDTDSVASRPDEKIEIRSSAAGVKASPKVRRLARRLGVDLETVSGTGPGGQITSEDVQSEAD